MKVTIFDYGAGNLHSLAKAISEAGVTVAVEPDPMRAIETDVLVLPGVGAFGPAARRLAPGLNAMRSALGDGLPCLGICLGMHLLFADSQENDGADTGLGLIAGTVARLDAVRVPQIGWNTIDAATDPLLVEAPLPYAYYANGYVCRVQDETSVVRAWSTHEGDRFPALVRWRQTIGVQFHPEKSSTPGLRFIRTFLDSTRQP